MVKANLTLPNGTEITIDGTPDEVHGLLDRYGRSEPAAPPRRTTTKKSVRERTATKSNSTTMEASETVDLAKIVNLVKNCDEAESIESQILERASQVDRVLLSLYIIHEYLDDAFGLSSGDIARFTRELGVPVSQPNASRTLSGTASKYVMGDGVRKRGTKLTYKLSRRGVKYIKGVLSGKSNEE
jgi:hypothetical protein